MFSTKCHISTLKSDEPVDMNKSRRSLLARVGLMATVGHVTLYGASCIDNNNNGICDSDEQGPF